MMVTVAYNVTRFYGSYYCAIIVVVVLTVVTAGVMTFPLLQLAITPLINKHH